MQIKPDAARLADLISAHAPYDGMFELRIPGLYAIKVTRPSTTAIHSFQQTAARIVVQGKKRVMIGDDV